MENFGTLQQPLLGKKVWSGILTKNSGLPKFVPLVARTREILYKLRSDQNQIGYISKLHKTRQSIVSRILNHSLQDKC